MSLVPPFDETFRREVAGRLASFARDPLVRDPLGGDPIAAGSAHRLKRAAVAIALVRAGAGAGFLLTRRSAHLRAHGRQWALPGGRCDDGETAAQAALRELDEELGVSLGERDVLGLLDDYPTRSGYLITPVVVWAGARPRLRPNPQEVESVHRVGIAQIARDNAVDFTTIPESTRQVVRIRIVGRLIHAPTAALLYQFREVLAGRHTRVAELEQPRFAWR